MVGPRKLHVDVRCKQCLRTHFVMSVSFLLPPSSFSHSVTVKMAFCCFCASKHVPARCWVFLKIEWDQKLWRDKNPAQSWSLDRWTFSSWGLRQVNTLKTPHLKKWFDILRIMLICFLEGSLAKRLTPLSRSNPKVCLLSFTDRCASVLPYVQLILILIKYVINRQWQSISLHLLLVQSCN